MSSAMGNNRLTAATTCILSVFVLFTALFSFSCSSANGIQGSGNSEADQEIEKFWDARVTKCGDSHYMMKTINYNGPLDIYSQFKEPKIKVAAMKVSEAEKANGLEWEGVTGYYPKMSRAYNAWEPFNKWSGWVDGKIRGIGDLEYHVKKENGKWTIDSVQDRLGKGEWKKPDCSKIPQ